MAELEAGRAEGPGLSFQRAPGPVAAGRLRLRLVRAGQDPQSWHCWNGGLKGDIGAYRQLRAWAPRQPDKATLLRFFGFCFLYSCISLFAVLFLHYFHLFAALCENHSSVDFHKLTPLIELIGPQEDFTHLWEPQLP